MPPSPAPSPPAPPPGWPSGVGVLRWGPCAGVLGSLGPNPGTPPQPTHLSPSRPPCLALGSIFLTTTPPQLRPEPWPGRGPPHRSQPGQPPPAPQKPDFPSKPAREAWRTHLIMKRRPSLPAPPPVVGGRLRTRGRSVCPQGPSTGWPLGTKARLLSGTAGALVVVRPAGSPGSFSAGNLKVWAGGGGEGHGRPQLPNFAWCLVEDSVTWLLTSARGG